MDVDENGPHMDHCMYVNFDIIWQSNLIHALGIDWIRQSLMCAADTRFVSQAWSVSSCQADIFASVIV